MSSFRVERQRVSFLSQAELVRDAQTKPTEDSESERQLSQAVWEKQQAEHEKAYARQMLETSRQEAEQIRKQAHQEADRILAEAKKQAQLLLEEEKKRGYAEGRQDAAAAEEQWKAGEADKLCRLAAQLEQTYQTAVDEVQRDAGELAAEIAEKIIGIRLQESDEAFRNVIAAAAARFRQSDSITVLLGGEDYRRYLGAHLDELTGKAMTLEKNDSLGRGDCILESEDQIVDCGVSGQLRRLRGILQESGGEEEEHEQNGAEVQGAAFES